MTPHDGPLRRLMRVRIGWLLGLLIGGIVVGSSAGWVAARTALAVAGTAQADRLLRPAWMLLQENQRLRGEVMADAAVASIGATTQAPGGGVLPAYLALIRRDGVPPHARLKQRLDQIAANDAALAALLAAHSPAARTAGFAPQAERFRDYAAAWRDRWTSVMELLMAGGSFPALEPPVPPGLQAAIQAELETFQ